MGYSKTDYFISRSTDFRFDYQLVTMEIRKKLFESWGGIFFNQFCWNDLDPFFLQIE